MRRIPVLVLATLSAVLAGCSEPVDPEVALAEDATELREKYSDLADVAVEDREAAAEELERASDAVEACEVSNADLSAALQEINSRLSVGMNIGTYGEYVGNARVAYDLVDFDELVPDDATNQLVCLGSVTVNLETAMSEYIEVLNIWSECISDYPCSAEDPEIDGAMQAGWLAAGVALDAAEDGLEQVGVTDEVDVPIQARFICDDHLEDMPVGVDSSDGLQQEWLEFAQAVDGELLIERSRTYLAPLMTSLVDVALADSANDVAELVDLAEEEADLLAAACDA